MDDNILFQSLKRLVVFLPITAYSWKIPIIRHQYNLVDTISNHKEEEENNKDEILARLDYHIKRYIKVVFFQKKKDFKKTVKQNPVMTSRSLLGFLVPLRDFFRKMAKNGPLLVPLLQKSPSFSKMPHSFFFIMNF